MIWLPESIYKSLPWLCLILATASLFVPGSIVKALCVLYLYMYSGYIFYKRLGYYAGDSRN
jgi:hypothetical protein